MHQQVSFKTLIYVWSDILKSVISINYDSSNLEEFDSGKKQNILRTEQIIVRCAISCIPDLTLEPQF